MAAMSSPCARTSLRSQDVSCFDEWRFTGTVGAEAILSRSVRSFRQQRSEHAQETHDGPSSSAVLAGPTLDVASYAMPSVTGRDF